MQLDQVRLLTIPSVFHNRLAGLTNKNEQFKSLTIHSSETQKFICKGVRSTLLMF